MREEKRLSHQASSGRARRWLWYGLDRIAWVALVLGFVVTYAVVHDRGKGTGKGELGLTMTRSPGARALRSRCSECTQLGDAVTVTASGAEGIRVYLDKELVASCAGCSTLSFAVPSMGALVIVGFQPAAGKPCAIPNAGIDADLAGLMSCDARLAFLRLEVR